MAMSDPLWTRPRRAKGSLLPRLTGVAVVVLIAGGGAALVYSHASHRSQQPRLVSTTRPPASHGVSPAQVVTQHTVGLIDFGPYDDKDQAVNDPDDHPLMLVPDGTSMRFVRIPPSQLTAGTPQWTADQMADGTYVFIYIPTGRCLTAGPADAGLVLARCGQDRAQRWQPRAVAKAAGQAIAAYANAQTGGCITAPRRRPGPALLSPCGATHTRPQEIAFWWSL
jgi:hypothetical protein